MQITNLLLANLLLLILVIVEVLIIKFKMKEELPWKEIITNMNSGHILLWVFRGLEVAGYYYLATYFNLHLVDTLPYAVIWVLGFFMWDFCFYWLHRLHHYFSVLWSVHVVHHEGEHFSLSLGIRNSWYSSLTSFPFFIGMAVIGIPVEVFVATSSIHYVIQFYNHNHFVKKSGWLEYILVTPSHHRVHHGKNDPYIDKNFGGTLVFWDKLFGSYQSELVDNPVQFGVKDPVKSYNPILINNVPILELLHLDFAWPTLKKVTKAYSNKVIVSGAILMFLYLLLYIYFENSLGIELKLFLFTTIFLGTIGNGMMVDELQVGAWIWNSSAFMALLFMWIIPFDLFNLVLCGLFVVHGIYVVKNTK